MNKYIVEYEIKDTIYYMEIEAENEKLVPYICISKASKEYK